MMTFSESIGSPFVIRIGGEDRTFARLRIRDIGELQQHAEDAERKRIMADCEACGVVGQARYAELQKWRKGWIGMVGALRYVSEPDGAAKAVSISLRVGGWPIPEEEIRNWPFDETFMALARRVIGLPDLEVDEPKNAPTPGAIGASGTGSPTASA